MRSDFGKSASRSSSALKASASARTFEPKVSASRSYSQSSLLVRRPNENVLKIEFLGFVVALSLFARDAIGMRAFHSLSSALDNQSPSVDSFNVSNAAEASWVELSHESLSSR